MRRTCGACGREFEAKRATAKWCGSSCRARASTGRVANVQQAPPAPTVDTEVSAATGESISEATRKELEGLGRADTAIGRTCLALAERMDARMELSGTAVAALANAFRAALTEARQGAAQADDPVDELRARRARKGK